MRLPAVVFSFLTVFSIGMRPVFCQQAGDSELLTLDQAVKLAQQHNRLLRSYALEVRKYEDKAAQTRTLRLPSFSLYSLSMQRFTALDFVFPKGAFGVFPGIGAVPATETTIRSPLRLATLLVGRVDQPLSQQYRISLSLHALDLGRQIAAEQVQAQQQTVINQVKDTYYSIMQMQSALACAQESIKLYKELDRVTEQYVQQQVALKAESLEIKTRLAKAEYDALTIRNPMQTQKENLNNLLGRDLQTEFRVEAVPEPPDVGMDLAEAKRLALQQRPELRQARLKVEQAEYDRRIKKSEYIPDISLNFSYLSPFNFGPLVPNNIAGAGLLVNWEPLDWGKKKHELAEKSRTVTQAELALDETKNQISIEVASKFRKVEETRQLVVVTQSARETALEKLRVVKNRYAQEAFLLKDVLQAEAALAEANSQYQQAVQSHWTACADFEKALSGGY